MNNNSLKRFTLVACVSATIGFAGSCAAQTNQSKRFSDFLIIDANTFTNVTFSVGLTNDVLTVGSTNVFQCRLENHSTNEIHYMVMSPGSAMTVRLTNDANSYSIAGLQKPKPHEMGMIRSEWPVTSFVSVNANTTAEWMTPFVIGNDIVAGNYTVIADQFVMASNREGCVLTSRLDVKVVK